MACDMNTLSVERVCEFIAEHPDILVTHPELIEQLTLPELPSDIVGIAEYRSRYFQQKNDKLSQKMQQLVQHAEQNDILRQKVHQLCLAALAEQSIASVLAVLQKHMLEAFDIQHIAIVLQYETMPYAMTAATVTQYDSEQPEWLRFSSVLAEQQPYCGRLTQEEKTFLFGDTRDAIGSVACLPLDHVDLQGMLVIAHESEQRFYADMATDYLGFLSKVIGQKLAQLITNEG